MYFERPPIIVPPWLLRLQSNFDTSGDVSHLILSLLNTSLLYSFSPARTQTKSNSFSFISSRQFSFSFLKSFLHQSLLQQPNAVPFRAAAKSKSTWINFSDLVDFLRIPNNRGGLCGDGFIHTVPINCVCVVLLVAAAAAGYILFEADCVTAARRRRHDVIRTNWIIKVSHIKWISKRSIKIHDQSHNAVNIISSSSSRNIVVVVVDKYLTNSSCGRRRLSAIAHTQVNLLARAFWYRHPLNPPIVWSKKKKKSTRCSATHCLPYIKKYIEYNTEQSQRNINT